MHEHVSSGGILSPFPQGSDNNSISSVAPQRAREALTVISEPDTIPGGDIVIFMGDAGITLEQPPVQLAPEKVVKTFEEVKAEWLQPAEVRQNLSALHIINTELWLRELSDKYGTPITFGTVPRNEWEHLFENYDALWYLGMRPESKASKEHQLKYAYQHAEGMDDYQPERDLRGSPYASPDLFNLNTDLVPGGWPELEEVAELHHERGRKFILDFVPNHVANDHPMVKQRPGLFVQGSAEQYARRPDDYNAIIGDDGEEHYIAKGWDSNKDTVRWADTAQWNFGEPEVQEYLISVLKDVYSHGVDGVRCDMAMLPLYETFVERTWGPNSPGGDHLTDQQKDYLRDHPFWKRAIHELQLNAQEDGRTFEFIAEAYWDLGSLLDSGFQWIYEKGFYDHLRGVMQRKESPHKLNELVRYFVTNPAAHGHHVHFSENHDEDPAAKVFKPEQMEPSHEGARTAAIITAFFPRSTWLLNQGQEEGRLIKRHMQHRRMPDEAANQNSMSTYERINRYHRSRLFQEGEWDIPVLWDSNPYVVAKQVKVYEEQDAEDNAEKKVNLGAIIVSNTGWHFSSGRIPEIDKDTEVEVVDLNTGEVIQNIDTERTYGLFFELPPQGNQLIMFRRKPESNIDIIEAA